MAFRLAEEVVHGHVDNTRKGVVTGEIWLAGCAAPIRLELSGNGHPDLAGCRCIFRNPAPQAPGRPCELVPVQRGRVGDMTASRKVRVLDPSAERALAGDSWPEAAPPPKWGNALYLEWYSEANGRVVIESASFEVELDLPQWRLSETEIAAQAEQSRTCLEDFLHQLELHAGVSEQIVPEAREMDEHEWEIFLRNADARTERFGELLDKYGDLPDRDRRVDQGMGWTGKWREVAAEAGDDGDDGWGPLPEDFAEPPPDPAREGIDWVRDERGEICHPVYLRARRLCYRVIDETRAFRDEADDLPSHRAVAELRFQTQRLSSKLAGALNGLARDSWGEAGFVIASLKRVQPILAAALDAVAQVEAEGVLADSVEEVRAELFALRADIFAVMERLRRHGRKMP